MKVFLIATQIEVEEGELPTAKAIRDKIETDLNRGDGLCMVTDPKVCTIRPLRPKPKKRRSSVPMTSQTCSLCGAVGGPESLYVGSAWDWSGELRVCPKCLEHRDGKAKLKEARSLR